MKFVYKFETTKLIINLIAAGNYGALFELSHNEEKAQEVVFQLEQLNDLGFVRGVSFCSYNRYLEAKLSCPRLTIKGFELLEVINNDLIYKEIRKAINRVGRVESLKLVTDGFMLFLGGVNET